MPLVVHIQEGVVEAPPVEAPPVEAQQAQQRCRCGSATHLRTNHSDCPMKKKRAARVTVEGPTLQELAGPEALARMAREQAEEEQRAKVMPVPTYLTPYMCVVSGYR